MKNLVTLTAFTWLACHNAFADDIDKAFGAQKKAPAITTRTDSSVHSAADAHREAVRERALEREEDRAEQMRALRERQQEQAAEQASQAPAAAPAARVSGNYSCNYICHQGNLVAANEKSGMNYLDMSATSASDANSQALPLAKQLCWERYRMQLYTRWVVGGVSCKAVR
jgi:hypothetical protein